MTELAHESKLSPLALFALTFVVAGFGFVLIGPLIGFSWHSFFDGSIMDQLPQMGPRHFSGVQDTLYIMQGAAT